MKLDSSVKVGETAKITVPVTNTGSRDGEEVVQVYLKKNGETDGPIKTLRAFKRVRIPAGKTVKVELELTPKQLEWWDNTTNTMRTMQNYLRCIGRWKLSRERPAKENTKTVIRNR